MKEYFKYFRYLSKDLIYYEPIEEVKELDEFHVDISDNKWKVTISKDSVWKFYNKCACINK